MAIIARIASKINKKTPKIVATLQHCNIYASVRVYANVCNIAKFLKCNKFIMCAVKHAVTQCHALTHPCATYQYIQT